QILAYTLDSLVRVSRRVNKNHFVNISNPLKARLPHAPPLAPADSSPKSLQQRWAEPHLAGGFDQTNEASLQSLGINQPPTAARKPQQRKPAILPRPKVMLTRYQTTE